MIRRGIWAILCFSGATAAGWGCDGQSPFSALVPTARVMPASGGATTAAATDDQSLPPASIPENALRLQVRLLALVNAQRQEHGVPLLAMSAPLGQLADYHTTRMIDGDFFSHVDPFDRSNVGTRAAKFDYPFVKVGENLAAGQPTAEQVIADWMASPAHRDNLLDAEFTEAGIAVVDGGRFGRYWAIEFGKRIGQ